jgi:C-terminal processing protease CtpA/Prc
MKLRSLLLLTSVFTISASYAQTRQQIDNLYTFARLYGYVRYFHPSDAVVVTDWDKLAIYGAKQVAQASSQQALQQTLERLFHPVAPTLQLYPTGSNPPFNTADITPKDTSGMKVVCWQHDSYGLSGGNDYNKSVRTNSYMRAAEQTAWNFSLIADSIDAKPYQGGKVRLSASVKAKDLREGTFRLWMRTALPNNNDSRGLYEDMRFDPITGISKNWRRYTISGKIDPDAQELYFGFSIANKGRLLIDDIRLEVETTNGWERVRELNGDFEGDIAGTAPAFWDSNGDKYLVARTTDEQAATGRHSLYMERTESRTGMEKTQTLFRQTLPSGAVIRKDIGSGLSITMPVALWGDGERTYPFTDTARITRWLKTMAAKLPSPLSADDLYVRLADIIIAWNVIQHFHPYYAEWPTNWHADLREALEACYKNNTQKDFNITLKTFLAKIHDGWIYERIPDMRPPAFLPVYWEWVEQQLVITRVLDPGTQLEPGDVVTAINGVPAADYINQTAKTVSAGTPQAITETTLEKLIEGDKDSALLLSVTSARKQPRQARLSYSLILRDYVRRDPAMKAYQQIDTGIHYVNLLTMPWTELKQKLPELSKAAAVIFDLRGFPADNNARNLLPHLLKEPEHAKWRQRQQIILPDHEKTGWLESGWDLKPEPPFIGGKVLFLANGKATSISGTIMGYIKGQRLASIIGEPCSGINGSMAFLSLPGGYSFYFTGDRETNHDGSQLYMKGIQPDITVTRTVKGIREGRDELLEKAIEICK